MKHHRDFFNGKIENYESWRLRTFFLEEMRRIAPDWAQTLEESIDQQNVLASSECPDTDFALWMIRRWLDRVLEDKDPGRIVDISDCRSFYPAH